MTLLHWLNRDFLEGTFGIGNFWCIYIYIYIYDLYIEREVVTE